MGEGGIRSLVEIEKNKQTNDGHDPKAIQHYPGHKNIQHTVRITELSAGRLTNGFILYLNRLWIDSNWIVDLKRTKLF